MVRNRSSRDLVGEIGAHLLDRRLQLASAESLTGGALASVFAEAAQSSDWFLGGVVAYEKRIKFDVLKVPPGPVVSADAAREMVLGLTDLMASDVAVALTGVAGPDEQDDMPVGTVFVGIGSSEQNVTVTRLDLAPRSPAEIVRKSVDEAVVLLHRYLEGLPARGTV